jgi:sarcosine oxidase subunit alpha
MDRAAVARVPFTFDGHRYEGVEGEPVAVSLLAAGRRTLSRSFRFHRPRGLMCSTGQCGWCECEVDGRPSVRTCRVPLRAGMAVRGEHAWPSVEHDLLSGLGLGSRFVPPTFYHHRFLRPRRLRKAYLDVLRWFGGRGRLGNAIPAARPPRVLRSEAPDVLVIGGGRSGLLAAIAAAEAGVRVVVVEAEGRAPADDLLPHARALGVDIRLGTTATGWYGGMVTAIDEATIREFRPRAVVAATGSYELVPAVPGSDRPGVMGARLVHELITRHGVLPGRRALLVGADEDLAFAAAALREGGATVLGPVPTVALRAIGGRKAVAWATIDGANGPRRETVDLVVIGDRTPNLDVVLAVGAGVVWRAGRLAPDTDATGRTTVAGLFVTGDAAGLSAATATAAATAAAPDAGETGFEARARDVGRAAAEFARGRIGTATEATRPITRSGDPPRSTTDGRAPAAGSARAVLCFCEDVRGSEVRSERTAGYTDPELVKRRTGALTGPCQGKYCLSAITCAMGGVDPDPARPTTALPTGRPPLRPIRLGDLVTDEAPAGHDR